MLFNIRQIGSSGINTDIAPWDLPDNALSQGRNFRVMAGKVQSSGGSKPEFLEKTSGEIGHIAYTEDYNGARMWIACTTAGIEKYGDDNKWSVVSDMTTSDPSLWSSCRIGQVLFLNHPERWPMFFETATSGIQKLPWSNTQSSWESICNAKVLCSHKNFLFALNTGESPDIQRAITDTFADRVRWSHPVEPNGRPYTWQPAPTDPSSLAGFVTMGRGGEIIGAESMRDSFVIYSDYAINVMDYTGDQLMWRRRTVS